MNESVCLISLGCAKNLVDSEVMLGLLRGAGYQLTTDRSVADAIIVNTCGFLGAAVDESLAELQAAAKWKSAGQCRALVATGCLSQRDAGLVRTSVPGVDQVLGTVDFPRIVEELGLLLHPEQRASAAAPMALVTPTREHSWVYNEATPRVRATPPWTAYLKISEGCDHKCSFCIIPQLRGLHRSRPPASIVAEARNLAAEGVREVVLIAQDTTRYGRDLTPASSLSALLHQLSAIESLEWIRVLYAYPSQVDEEFVTTLTTAPRVARYLDIPLQHADGEVLARMRRGGNVEQYRRLLGSFREKCPEISIRTSFIVGFPGETEAQFETLCDFVSREQFDRIGVFRYSDESSALSHGLDGKLPQPVIEERYHRLQVLQQQISHAKNQRLQGTRMKVVLESAVKGGFQGRTERDAPEIDGGFHLRVPRARRQAYQPGDFLTARITGGDHYDLTGVPA